MADLAFVAGVAATIAQQQAQCKRRIIFHRLYDDGGIDAPPPAPELSYTSPTRTPTRWPCRRKRSSGGRPADSLAVATGHYELCEGRVARAVRNFDEATAERDGLRTNLAYHVNVFSWTMDDVLRARRDYTTARGAYTAGLTGLIAACDSAEDFPRPELFDGVDHVRNLDRMCQAAWALCTSAFEAHQQAADRLGFINPVHGLPRDDDDIPARLDHDFGFALYDLRRCKARCGELDAACREAAFSHFRTGNRRDADERTASADEYERFASRDLVIAEEEWARAAQRLAGSTWSKRYWSSGTLLRLRLSFVPCLRLTMWRLPTMMIRRMWWVKSLWASLIVTFSSLMRTHTGTSA
ncbi:hypothetical protein GE09DRAFT_1254444 [Coniochaeta sp. 2T2.1]|nr:hypothetical protein GE09DRAFT_1254444 [Coniochaeta sp. 2T2.1]